MNNLATRLEVILILLWKTLFSVHDLRIFLRLNLKISERLLGAEAISKHDNI